MINPEDLPHFDQTVEQMMGQPMRGPSDEERRGYALQMAVTLHAGSGEKGWELPASTLASANRFVRWLESGES